MRTRRYDEDPELHDEDDPEYKEELFKTMTFMGVTPEELKDPKDQEEYANWLEVQKNDSLKGD